MRRGLRQTSRPCARVRVDLQAAQAGIVRVTRLEDRTEFIRRLLREAGPRVTEVLLASVSDTADEIYSDIMGAPGGRLRWAADYDIVLGHGGLERRFGQLSGGEQMAAALAVRLALLRDLLNLDIAFFDEPTQHLDAERRENLAQQILSVRGFSQLVVISHDDTFERHIDNIIRVTHTGEASKVEGGIAASCRSSVIGRRRLHSVSLVKIGLAEWRIADKPQNDC